jgi:ribonucleoside-diphosphate reductase alpha chain
MSNGIKVQKRSGSVEPIDLEKMHKMVEAACEGLSGVSASQVEIQSGIQFYDGISTSEIQEILIRSASDLIDLEHPNYQYVAARLLLFALRKNLAVRFKRDPSLLEQIEFGISNNVYDKEILEKYTTEELEKVNTFIYHDRDYLFTYAGLRQVVDKYLVQDRSSGDVYETPQFMYVLIALTIFAEYPKETRLSYVKRYYDAISKHKINIPTPIMAGVRTFSLMLMTPSIVSLAVIWLLADTLHRGLVSASTQAESVASTVRSEVERYNTQAWSPSLKSLNQLYDAAHKTVSEVVLLQFTFLSGTKK